MKTIERIVEDIKDQISDCVELDEALDKASWTYEEGVLLSASDAQKILKHLTRPDLIEYWENRIKELEVVATKTGSREQENKALGEISAAERIIKQLKYEH